MPPAQVEELARSERASPASVYLRALLSVGLELLVEVRGLRADMAATSATAKPASKGK